MVQVITIALVAITGCRKDAPVPVALMTKLESGSTVGSSEVNAGRLFLEEHPDRRIELVPLDDGWDPVKAKAAYQEVKSRGIRILITSHVSSCAVAISEDINRDETLTFVTGAATDQLSGKDDYMIRGIPDVRGEQKSIAEYVNGMSQRRLLIVRDADNDAYTRPALDYFRRVLVKEKVRVLDISISKLDLLAIERQMREEDFDVVYLLIGGYRAIAGSLAQLSAKVHPGVKILFTPWMKSPALLEAAGPVIADSIVPSHYPPRAQSLKVNDYVERYKKRFGPSPTFISLNVYAALGIIHEGISHGHRTPSTLRSYILQKRAFETEFGTVTFDQFGDTHAPLYFITELAKEF